MVDILEMMIVMTHSSISSLFMTMLIVLGSVILTLCYVGWKRYVEEDKESNFIDKNESNE